MRVQDKRSCDAFVENAVSRGGMVGGTFFAFTALAIWTISLRIADISCRLYRFIGHWPVAKDSDFAQPKPIRSPKTPDFAFLSIPPGSSVTYRRGIPIAPPARVIFITAFNTFAGFSASVWLPWPWASNPTQSTAASTSGTARISPICSGSEPSSRKSIVSHPKECACASLSGFISPTTTTDASNRWQQAVHARPTGPAPATQTVVPGPSPAVTAP